MMYGHQTKPLSNLDMDITEQAYEKLWEDVDKENSFPHIRPLLAHYTSITTFESIIQHDELWFSHPLEMNDWEELIFGMREGAKAFRQHAGLRSACGAQKAHSKLVNYFDHYFLEFEDKHAFDTYILCFSEHDLTDNSGSLSMWRAYGQNGNGISLVIDSSEITYNESSPFIIAPVSYGSIDDRRSWINKKLDALSVLMTDVDMDDKCLNTLANQWVQRLIVFSLFSKHDGFREEKEWRIVYISDRDTEGGFKEMLSYHASNDGLQPKLKLKLKDIPDALGGTISLEKLIHRIILGPTTSSVLAEKTLGRLVEQKGKHSLTRKISASSIPFRHKK